MYLHIGEDILVRTKDIIAILDKESVKSSPFVQEFIEEQIERVIDLSKGSFKSVVITYENIYYSPLASGTLKKKSKVLSIQEY
ncbi:regulator of the extracellular matrix, regulation of biofilm formation [Bacillus methanolicus PB1]|uniref:Regulator of the extracellular matrix, regulation of biofilm formation n=1 Tax=Bacillus methanolicus PB1 TaxID=997296 RepID=I3E0X0_BACMT|nr:extracellular matrix/biofilm biosynthesis regulator RemA family protein [Bacillus methanolicus]EIJ80141.1 regulator of the extracellular matrix, regulation of biofilm formation [Bacillus methanolicus PB1]